MARRTTKSTQSVAVGKSGYALGSKRSDEQWDQLFAAEILPALQAGETMTSLRAQYGPSEKIRQAARRAGYATTNDARRGEQTFSPISVKGAGKAVAKRIATARQAGCSFNHISLRTGKDVAELKTLLRQHGYTDLANGRVLTSERSIKKAEKVAS